MAQGRGRGPFHPAHTARWGKGWGLATQLMCGVGEGAGLSARHGGKGRSLTTQPVQCGGRGGALLSARAAWRKGAGSHYLACMAQGQRVGPCCTTHMTQGKRMGPCCCLSQLVQHGGGVPCHTGGGWLSQGAKPPLNLLGGLTPPQPPISVAPVWNIEVQAIWWLKNQAGSIHRLCGSG